MRIHYYLDIDESTKKIVCRKCGKVICNADQNYKLHVPMAIRKPHEVYGLRPKEGKEITIYYEFYCPGCYTMLDVECPLPGKEPMWDIQIAV